MAMTSVYITATILTFIFNRNWTFGHEGHLTKAFIKYALVYVVGYLFNLVALYFLVDKLGYIHQWVQAGLVIVVAVLLFVLQKLVVFKNNENPI